MPLQRILKQPFCDGTHAGNGFDGTETAPAGGYASRARVMPGTGITVADDRLICEHAGFCGNRQTNVWDMLGGSGTGDSITRAQLMAMVERCPSGALTYRLERDGAAPVGALALNDVVLAKVDTGRTLDFETSINGRFVNSHGGDGIVVATATGSTAYALSCGGPIVEPNLDVWVLAPISPHTLSDRPIVVQAGSRVQIRLSERLGARAQVTCDGLVLGELEHGDQLLIEGADATITLLHPPGYDYYRLLRSKLHWGRGGQHGGNGE